MSNYSKTFKAPGIVPLALAGLLLLSWSWLTWAQEAYSFSKVEVPFAAPASEPNGGTSAYSINNRGEIVGSYGTQELLPDGTHPVDGFLLTHGKFVDVAIPGSTFTELLGINDRGVAVGDFFDSEGNDLPIIRQIDGTIQYLPPAAPGALLTEPTGLNNSGTIVGTSGLTYSRPDWRGFIYKDGVYTTYAYPHSQGTAFWGINDSGQIAGRYWDDDGRTWFHLKP